MKIKCILSLVTIVAFLVTGTAFSAQAPATDLPAAPESTFDATDSDTELFRKGGKGGGKGGKRGGRGGKGGKGGKGDGKGDGKRGDGKGDGKRGDGKGDGKRGDGKRGDKEGDDEGGDRPERGTRA